MPITLDEFKRVAATSGNTIAMGIDTPFPGSATITITEVPLVGDIIRLDDSIVNKGDMIDAATLASLRYQTAGPQKEGAGTFEYSVTDGPDQATGLVEVHTYSENPSMVFLGRTPAGGLEPYRLNADGTITNVADINPGTGSINFSGSSDYFTEFGGQLYFAADDGTNGSELWRIRADGVGELVLDINSGATGSNPSQFVQLGDSLYFRAFSAATGSELWRVKSDGTVEAVEIVAGSTGSNLNGLTKFGDAVYFSADDGTSGNELWRVRSDNVVELVDDFLPGIFGASPQFLTEFNGALYFKGLGATSGVGQELMRLNSNGTVELVQDLVPGGASSQPIQFVAASDSLYFTAFNTSFRPNLYRVKLDGTVEDLGETNPGANSNYALGAEFNGDFYFRATDPTDGSELWRRKADGTIEQVADIYPGAVTPTTGNSSPFDFTEINGFLYFSASSAAHGREVWRVKQDGTVERVTDINPGTGSSSPSEFLSFGGNVYVLATSNGMDFNTWQIEPDGTTTQLTAYGSSPFGVVSGNPGFVAFPSGLPEATSGDDVLFGTSADETIAGLAGDDTLAGEAGADMLDGGTGNDTVSYAGSGAAVQIDLGVGSATGGDATGDTLTSVESLIGSAFTDTLNGDGGNNVIEGGADADAIDGGSGADTASYASSASGVMVFLANGATASMASGGDAAGDTLVDIESLTGSAQNDILIGNDDANTLNGGGGTDEIGGGNGDDTLIGGDATDVLVGGTGADDLQGGGGFDIAFYLGSSSGVTIDLVAGTGSGGEAQGDTFDSVETIIGSAFDDVITGNAAANTLIGRDGADTFVGSAGGDILIGGNSVAVDTNMSDLVDYSGAATAEIGINLLNNSAQGTDIGVDQLFGIENVNGTAFGDLLRGDDNSNTLTGLGGGDLMFGQGGDDTIIGGSDGNVMTGGTGNDDFVFGATDLNSNSIITDFDQDGDDQLTFTGFGPGFDFADFTLNVVNGSDVNVTATGWSGSVYLQNAAGLVEVGDFQFL